MSDHHNRRGGFTLGTQQGDDRGLERGERCPIIGRQCRITRRCDVLALGVQAALRRNAPLQPASPLQPQTNGRHDELPEQRPT
jgi:hypothetical protein